MGGEWRRYRVAVDFSSGFAGLPPMESSVQDVPARGCSSGVQASAKSIPAQTMAGSNFLLARTTRASWFLLPARLPLQDPVADPGLGEDVLRVGGVLSQLAP